MDQMRFAFGVGLVVLTLVTVLDPMVASAQEASSSQRALARDLFGQGVTHARAENWGEAREAFQQAYDLVPQPTILLNLASAQVQSGRLVEGAETYRQFLREVTSGRLAVHREAAQQALTTVEGRIPRLELRIQGLNSDDVVKLDGEPLIAAAVQNELPISPGDHNIVVLRDGEEWANQDFTMAERELRSLDVELVQPVHVPTPEELAAQQQQQDRTLDLGGTDNEPDDNGNLWLYVGAGAGAAAVVVLVVVLVLVTGGGTANPYQDGNLGVLTVP